MDEISKLITQEKYEEALKKLLIMDGNYLQKTQCLYEMKKYDELKSFFESISDKIEKEYYEILGFYILSLLELEEFDKALSVLNEELSMPYIESPYDVVLDNLYDDVIARKRLFLSDKGLENIHIHEHDVKEVLLDGDDFDTQLQLILNLDKLNIRNIFEELSLFLENQNKNSILKSFILELLIKQQISDEVIINKNGLEYAFLPMANQLVLDNHNYLITKNNIEDRLEKNPSFLQMALDVLDMTAYLIYPQLIDSEETKLYAAAIEYYVYSLNMEEIDNSLYSYYDLNEKIVEGMVSYIVGFLQPEDSHIHSLW
ncbi:hypothetical protein [Mycoplasma sp. P36-A1]|uniref:hypothetical protein n=1 Tax=Mycoplasma sp. P36-A1 TaxID=3252900 RepID=UPI003C2F65F6